MQGAAHYGTFGIPGPRWLRVLLIIYVIARYHTERWLGRD